MMWITKEMSKDFEENITWIPRATSFENTLEDVCDALAMIDYQIEIKKNGPQTVKWSKKQNIEKW